MATLKQAREAKQLTQQALADLVNMTNVEICNIERGRCFPHPINRERIEAVVGVVDWVSTRLLGGVSFGFREGDSPEDLVMKRILEFIQSAQRSEVPGRIQFIRDILSNVESQQHTSKKERKKARKK